MAGRADKVILITGASSGIGAAVAREAARQKYRLVLAARRTDRLEELARALGTEALVVPVDLADPESPERLVQAALDRFDRLDVLINNAGVGLPQLFTQADPEEIHHQILVNLAAPLLLTRIALPYLVARQGTVINVGSAITCVPNAALGAYGATKAGLAYWNDALRREVRHRGVKVCLVEPGPVATEFFDAMGVIGKQGKGIYNPLRDPTHPLMNIAADDAARHIVRLIERPRRRIAVCKRVVWPYRVTGALFGAWPWLGDVAISSMIRHLERTTPGGVVRPRPQRSPDDVRSTQ